MSRQHKIRVQDLVRVDNDGSPIIDDILMNELFDKIGIVVDRGHYNDDNVASEYTWNVLIDGKIHELFENEMGVISQK